MRALLCVRRGDFERIAIVEVRRFFVPLVRFECEFTHAKNVGAVGICVDQARNSDDQLFALQAGGVQIDNLVILSPPIVSADDAGLTIGLARHGGADGVGGRPVLQGETQRHCGVARGVGEIARSLRGMNEGLCKSPIGKAADADRVAKALEREVVKLRRSAVWETTTGHNPPPSMRDRRDNWEFVHIVRAITRDVKPDGQDIPAFRGCPKCPVTVRMVAIYGAIGDAPPHFRGDERFGLDAASTDRLKPSSAVQSFSGLRRLRLLGDPPKKRLRATSSKMARTIGPLAERPKLSPASSMASK